MTCLGGTGLVNALKLLQPIKEKYSNVTYADLFQLASATAIEVNPLFSFKVTNIKLESVIGLILFLSTTGSWRPQDSYEIRKSRCIRT